MSTNSPIIGLTSAEVEERKRQGLVNDIDLSSSRSLADIIKSNFLSVANVALLLIVAVLLILGKVPEALATGGVVVVNVFLGAFQEYRAKIKLDRIALLTRPKVRVIRDGQEIEIAQNEVVVGDAIVLQAGDQAVVDGRLVKDPRTDAPPKRVDMDESLLTGESDLIPKYPGDEILSGSFCVSGSGIFIAEKVGNEAFAQKLTVGARKYTVTLTPLQKQISILVRLLVVVALSIAALLWLQSAYTEKDFGTTVEDTAVTVSLIPQGLLLMITVSYALGALRIANKGALVQQSNAVESISHVDILCLDKTGTLTTNRILFHDIHPLGDHTRDELQRLLGDYIASVNKDNRTAEAIAEALAGTKYTYIQNIPFSSARKWSAASFDNEVYCGTYVLGASGMMFKEFAYQALEDELAKKGLRVLVFAHTDHIIRDVPDDREPELPPDLKPLCLVSLSDELRPNVNEVLSQFRQAGITLKLISGDNPTTVAALAYQAGFHSDEKAISGMELAQMGRSEFEQAVDENTIFGRITPQQKEAIVEVLRRKRHYVAMMGDGVNDVLSLKKAHVGIAMEDGSQATRSIADIILLGNKFEALPYAFMEGQRILNAMNDVTRLFLTRTFYTIFLIIIAGYIGVSEFPITPLHNFLLTSLPVGIPAFFLTVWARAGQPEDDLISNMTRFVLPAGLSFTFVATFIWVLYRTYGHADVETSRTALTTAGMIGGIWIIMLANQNGGYKIQWHDYRRLALAGVMLLIYVIIMLIGSLRNAFELTTLSLADLAIITLSVSAWAFILDAIWRYELIGRLLIPDYGKDSAPQIQLKVD
ncbi:MAG: haloacid dehalogenase [Phototrophicales bacterium]|nr:MAG: haloacid dehalogenase [Phototrophicales bacterium]